MNKKEFNKVVACLKKQGFEKTEYGFVHFIGDFEAIRIYNIQEIANPKNRTIETVCDIEFMDSEQITNYVPFTVEMLTDIIYA